MAKFVYPDKLLHELFREQAERTPTRIAIIDPGVEPSDYRQMAYSVLQAQSDTLSLWLRHTGVGEGKIVPIYMERCLEFALCYVSILKAGGAYLPLEIGYPSDMMRRVIVEVEAIVTLTMPAAAGALPDEAARFEMSDGWLQRATLTGAQTAALPPITTGMDSMAYCVYSSGTTGVPKGIICPHRGSVFSYSHRMYASPYAADGSDKEAVNVFFVWEMFRPLLGGASLVVIPDSVICKRRWHGPEREAGISNALWQRGLLQQQRCCSSSVAAAAATSPPRCPLGRPQQSNLLLCPCP